MFSTKNINILNYDGKNLIQINLKNEIQNVDRYIFIKNNILFFKYNNNPAIIDIDKMTGIVLNIDVISMNVSNDFKKLAISFELKLYTKIRTENINYCVLDVSNPKLQPIEKIFDLN